MKTTLSTFMSIALVALVISTLIFGVLYNKMNDYNDDVNTYIEQH